MIQALICLNSEWVKAFLSLYSRQLGSCLTFLVWFFSNTPLIKVIFNYWYNTVRSRKLWNRKNSFKQQSSAFDVNTKHKDFLYAVVGVNINIMKTTFYLCFIVTKLFTSLHVIKEKSFKLTVFLCFHLFVYLCCLNAWYKSKLKPKVVFIVLVLSPTTVAYHFTYKVN